MTAPATPRRRGRRPAGEDTRGAILAAALQEFAAKGYNGTTLRGIARAAGVDARLVHHYFEGKDDVFVQAVGFPVLPRQIAARLAGPGPDGIGERLVRTFFGVWESPGGRERAVALLSTVAGNPELTPILRDFISREILAPVAAMLGGDDPELRATLAASQMIGVLIVRAVVGVEPLASADVEDLVPLLAPTLERYLSGE